MYKLILIVFTFIFLNSCMTTVKPPSTEELRNINKVSVINHSPNSSCRYLGELFGYKHHYKGMFDIFKMKRKNSLNFALSLKKQVIGLGGNTAVMLMKDHGPARNILMYSVYKC